MSVIRGTTITTPIARHAVPDDAVVSKKPWSSKNTVDKLCPSFTESGSAVRCEPVEGYPLTVVTSEEATEVVRCGKNIFDIATAGLYHNNPNVYWCDMYVTETGFRLEPITTGTSNWSYFGFCLGTAKELAGKTITISAKASTSITSAPLPWAIIASSSSKPTSVHNKPTYQDGGHIGSFAVLSRSNSHNGYATVTYTVTGEEERTYIAILFQMTYGGAYTADDWTEWSDIQVEIGDTATEFEPYRGDTFEPSQQITALQGVNTLYADAGDITVSGKADPTATINRLTNAIIALGGNV